MTPGSGWRYDLADMGPGPVCGSGWRYDLADVGPGPISGSGSGCSRLVSVRLADQGGTQDWCAAEWPMD